MHWTTFVLILVGILTAGFVGIMHVATKYDAERLKAKAIKDFADVQKLAENNKYKKTRKTSSKRGGHLD